MSLASTSLCRLLRCSSLQQGRPASLSCSYHRLPLALENESRGDASVLDIPSSLPPLAAADGGTATLPLGASQALESLYGPTAAAVDCLSSLQASTGLPWWATLALAATGVRAAFLPLTIQQLRSAAANFPLLRQAVQNSLHLPGSPDLGKGHSRLQLVLEDLRRLRAEHKPPALAWIVAGPLIQLPVFLTAVVAVRRMATMPWPGFQTGGVGWFRDMSFPAILWEPAISAPLGSWGILLPAAATGLLMLNLHLAFGRLGGGVAGGQRLLQIVRLCVEWLTLPVFLTAMHLPQAVLVYWSASSAFALLQTSLLASEFARSRLGPRSPAVGNSTREPRHVEARLQSAEVEEAIRELGADVPALFEQAAEWRAAGQPQAAARALEKVIEQEQGNARAWFALGQTLSGMKLWRLAENAYTEATKLEADPVVLARAWLGAGIAAYRDGDAESGLQALRTASATALSARAATAPEDAPPSGAALLFTGGKLRRGSEPAAEKASTDHAATQVAVRALLSQGSICRELGKQKDALEAVALAAQFDKKAEQMRRALLAEQTA